MVGDTVNLSENEKQWHFHTPNPGTDLGTELNPHFDSLEGLLEEPAFLRDSEGLDCSIFLSCGPFDLPVGREVPFSFCIIFGQNENDLINNARFAQVMYNSKYQGFTPPARPNVFAESDTGLVKIYWDDIAEISTDVLTGYSDFEGYKIYKSIDGGTTWGGASDRIYDTNSINRLRLLGTALKNLKKIDSTPVVYITLSQKELNQNKFKKGDTEGFVNYGLSLEGILLAVIMIENEVEKIIKMSFRSKGSFDVNKFAKKYFNGGGHINAAGGLSNLTLDETVEQLIKVIAEEKSKFYV